MSKKQMFWCIVVILLTVPPGMVLIMNYDNKNEDPIIGILDDGDRVCFEWSEKEGKWLLPKDFEVSLLEQDDKWVVYPTKGEWVDATDTEIDWESVVPDVSVKFFLTGFMERPRFENEVSAELETETVRGPDGCGSEADPTNPADYLKFGDVPYVVESVPDIGDALTICDGSIESVTFDFPCFKKMDFTEDAAAAVESITIKFDDGTVLTIPNPFKKYLRNNGSTD